MTKKPPAGPYVQVLDVDGLARLREQEGDEHADLVEGILRERLAFLDSPQCRAWTRLVELLGAAKTDPLVVAWPAAKEFAELAQRKAGDSLEVTRVIDTSKAVDAAYRALPPSQRGRHAAGIIARKLGITATAVRKHLIALGHREKRK